METVTFLNWLYWPNMALVSFSSTPLFSAPLHFLKMVPSERMKKVVGILKISYLRTTLLSSVTPAGYVMFSSSRRSLPEC